MIGKKDEGDQLEANRSKRKRDVKRVADTLNKIQFPVTATVYSHGMQWTIRNVAFWEALKKQEEEFMDLIQIQAK